METLETDRECLSFVPEDIIIALAWLGGGHSISNPAYAFEYQGDYGHPQPSLECSRHWSTNYEIVPDHCVPDSKQDQSLPRATVSGPSFRPDVRAVVSNLGLNVTNPIPTDPPVSVGFWGLRQRMADNG
ncbi:hypothetical protein ElyMa_006797400 [Elysia marginata]|uniref:Uncharacterized protein n=1 Tax=Elysia marginata TaxID=1093978 RepID=A0AAV4J155_9GAST|nr:hypothetical protein ElyMa_006797400 [Elysia marginata]